MTRMESGRPPLTPNGIAADFRARLGDRGIRLPVRATNDNPGYVVDAAGTLILGVNVKGLDLDGAAAIELAAAFAAAVNWYAGLERS